MDVIKAPDQIDCGGELSVFLAGSIEMGEAPDWQTEIIEQLVPYYGKVLNPRRDDWHPEWQPVETNPHFVQQFEWELEGLETVDIVFMYFVPGSASPITLQEHGTLVDVPEAIVCCPEGFWRRGNVKLLSQRYGLAFYDDLGSAVEHLVYEVKSRQ